VSSTLFLRGDGGCGSFGTAPAGLSTAAPGPVEFSDQLATARNAALLYRLNGDMNPIHVDPAAAASAGFERPILHGLCTYAIAGYLLTRTVCGHDPTRLRALGVRFSSPVYPGETVRIEGCRSPGGVQFQVSVPERGQVVLSHGFAAII
jgi:acyl dehydratase